MQHTPERHGFRLGLAALTAAASLGGTAACRNETPAAQDKPNTRVATGAPAPAPVAGQAEARARLRDLERSYRGRIGVYALDTGTGKTISYRDQESYPMLSTFKAMAAAAVLTKARRSEPGLLDRRIHWTPADEVPTSPVTRGRGARGMTVAQLCEAAVTRSDNTAGNLILRQIGGPRGLTAYLRSLGDRRSRLDRWETGLNLWRPGERRDTTTPASMGLNLWKVTLGAPLAAPDRERLNGWLRANTTGGARIAAGLPDDWTVGDKTGTSNRYGAANDIAVAWPPSGAPLIIAIYTNRKAADGTTDNTVIARTATIAARGLGRLP
ncbi:beta-lactamase [Actinomadura sp. NBRC 104412]|uniref:class A beta-lactamase n=1 Tax=Actinomadura sp. NBRC 104412 TaxID=3032203 RepID=UPI0024A15266|nr:class A beta-lactamase [Actinomadura sp. NBRC 104412]GLZ09477.1 beta-lactamase [Actinomadura sp. NBRC 104412]